MIAKSVAQFLQDQGHTIYLARQELLPGTPDATVVALASELNAIVVTLNRKHYRPLISRHAASLRRFPRARLVILDCNPEPKHVIELLGRNLIRIELEFILRQTEADSRLIVEVRESGLLIR